ncbi:MAG TPA: hypothetical protein VHO94_02255 [Oscillospiraceae bacterium]|nr:hypothetical protein [Oscillospiraceae bacterium]
MLAKATAAPINLLYIGCFQIIAAAKGLDSAFRQIESFGYLRIIFTCKAQSAYGAFFFIGHAFPPKIRKGAATNDCPHNILFITKAFEIIVYGIYLTLPILMLSAFKYHITSGRLVSLQNDIVIVTVFCTL